MVPRTVLLEYSEYVRDVDNDSRIDDAMVFGRCCWRVHIRVVRCGQPQLIRRAGGAFQRAAAPVDWLRAASTLVFRVTANGDWGTGGPHWGTDRSLQTGHFADLWHLMTV